MKLHTPIRGLRLEVKSSLVPNLPINLVDNKQIAPAEFKYPVTIGGVKWEQSGWEPMFQTTCDFATVTKYHKSDCVIGYIVSSSEGLHLQEEEPKANVWCRQVYITQNQIQEMGYLNVSAKLKDLAWKYVVSALKVFELDLNEETWVYEVSVQGNGKISTSRWMFPTHLEAWLNVKHGIYGAIEPLYP